MTDSEALSKEAKELYNKSYNRSGTISNEQAAIYWATGRILDAIAVVLYKLEND